MMRKKLALCMAAMLLFMNFPPLHMHAHAETVINNIYNVTCDCDPITEPEMRALFEEYLDIEATALSATMVYNVGWAPEIEALKSLKVYADIESGFNLVDWSYYQPKSIDNEWREGLYTGDVLRAYNVLGRKLPVFYNIEFPNNSSTVRPTMSQVYPAPESSPLPSIPNPDDPPVTPPTEPEEPPVGEDEPIYIYNPYDPDVVDPAPMQVAPGASTYVGPVETYPLADKRSLIIMAIYKAMGIEYFNKPVIYSTLLGYPDKEAYRLLDTPFFKQMPSADLKWNDYAVINARGRSYLFLDNNYLEAYIVRAVNDSVIQRSTLTPEFRSLIENNYISKGASINGSVTSGNCEDYLIINRNFNQGVTDTSSYRHTDIGVVYNIGQDGSIKYNPNFMALNNEGFTSTMEFCEYAYKIMYSVGAPVATDQEKKAMFSLLGAKLPKTITTDQLTALGYLIVRGVIPSDITTEKLYSKISNNDLMVYLSRIADPNTRLSYSYQVSPMDLTMAEQGFAKTEVVAGDADTFPENVQINHSPDVVLEYDYFIPKAENITPRNVDTGEYQLAYFSLSAPHINPSWGRQLDDILIDNVLYQHYKLPIKEPEGYDVKDPRNGYYVLNSQNPEDFPLYTSLPPGGGIYEYDRNLHDAEGPGATPGLRRAFTSNTIEGNWEGKEVVDDSVIPEIREDMTPFAESTGTSSLSFFVKDKKRLSVLGVDLKALSPSTTPKEFQVDGAKVTINLEDTTFNGESGTQVTVTIPETMNKVISRMIKVVDGPKSTYPAYVNKGSGQILVHSSFLLDQCGIKIIQRNEQKYITLLAENGTGIETTIIRDKNAVVSGSTIISFGNYTPYEEESEDSIYIDYRAVANQLARTCIFTESNGVINVDTTAKKPTLAKISLWSDEFVKYPILKDSSKGISVNSIPSFITSTMILRKITDMEEAPRIVQMKPVVGETRQSSTAIQEFFGGETTALNMLDIVDLDISKLNYDEKTQQIWYKPVSRSEYSPRKFLEGEIALPIYDNGEYVIANVPLLKHMDWGALDLADYVASNTVNTTRGYSLASWLTSDEKNTLAKWDTFTRDSNVVVGSTMDLKMQLFPIGVTAYLHGFGNQRKNTEQLVETMKNSSPTSGTPPNVIYLAGGYYVWDGDIPAANASLTGSYYGFILSNNRTSDAQKSVNANRAAALAKLGVTQEKLGADGQIQIPKGMIFVPMQMAGAEIKGKSTSVYMSEAEIYLLELDGISSVKFGDGSIFGDLVENAKSLMETINKSDLMMKIRLEGFDGVLSIIYVVLIVIVPRILIASLISVASLSFVSDSKPVHWFASRVFDPVRLLSFGLVRNHELKKWTIWGSATLGIIFLVMVNEGMVDVLFLYLFEQVMTILDRIQFIY